MSTEHLTFKYYHMKEISVNAILYALTYLIRYANFINTSQNLLTDFSNLTDAKSRSKLISYSEITILVFAIQPHSMS